MAGGLSTLTVLALLTGWTGFVRSATTFATSVAGVASVLANLVGRTVTVFGTLGRLRHALVVATHFATVAFARRVSIVFTGILASQCGGVTLFTAGAGDVTTGFGNTGVVDALLLRRIGTVFDVATLNARSVDTEICGRNGVVLFVCTTVFVVLAAWPFGFRTCHQEECEACKASNQKDSSKIKR